MPKIEYVNKRFSAASMEVIDHANDILDEYAAGDLDLTLRQLYYQFVSRDIFPAHWFDKKEKTFNTKKNYKKLGNIIKNSRLAGHIDWQMIQDRTRSLKRQTHWDDPGQIVMAAYKAFKMDMWAGQRYRPEIWIEKDALTGIIAPVCETLDVDYFACKGYSSESAMWRAACRFKTYNNNDQVPVIIHLGDHDPSGMDMTRDITTRLKIFGATVIVDRIALNMDQVERYNPPPNPAKEKDSRSPKYVHQWGHSSWELDALEPKVLQQLIKDRYVTPGLVDFKKLLPIIDQQHEFKKILKRVADNWESL